jgi:hypothetical protein
MTALEESETGSKSVLGTRLRESAPNGIEHEFKSEERAFPDWMIKMVRCSRITIVPMRRSRRTLQRYTPSDARPDFERYGALESQLAVSIHPFDGPDHPLPKRHTSCHLQLSFRPTVSRTPMVANLDVRHS